MNRLIWLLSITLFLLLAMGCRGNPPSDTVVLADVSQSIDQSGTVYMFGRIDGLIDGMKRGDSLTIIPILSDAMSDAPGRVVQLTAPTERQPYDNDLTVFRQEAHAQVQKMRDAALAQPAKNTDIIGSLDAAKQVFDSRPAQDSKTLIVLSDFLEDDGTTRFTTDGALAEPSAVRKLAQRLQRQHGFLLQGIKVRLEALQSNELRAMRPNRQQSVREFWKSYFAPSSVVEIQISGGIISGS